MTTNTSVISDVHLPVSSPQGETLWRWIGWAFIAYWALFAASFFTGARDLNAYGGVLILAVLAWAALERLWVSVDAVFVACIAAMLLPLLHLFMGDLVNAREAIFKEESLCAVMAISRLLRLPLASQSRWRWLLVLPVLLILALSIAIGQGDANDLTRRAGLFVNPNNLALIPLLLLFLIDEARDPLVLRLCTHAVVVAVLLFTGTSGALIAYGIGMAVHMKSWLSAALRKWVLPLALLAGSATGILVVMNGNELLPETRLTKQLSLMKTEFKNVFEGGQVAYYDQERLLGPGTTSGVWRLAHWRRVVNTYLDGTQFQLIFGFGASSTERLLGKLPHNEYLRVLFEQGIAGAMIFFFAWGRIVRTAPASLRYVGLMVAIYSFSENNLDNFPFMSLAVLFLSAREVHARQRRADCSLPQFDCPAIHPRRAELCLSRSAQ